MEHYLFYSVVGLGISWLLYCLLLRREKCFSFNRFFLITSLILCLLAPLLELELELGTASSTLPEVDLSGIVDFPTQINKEKLKDYAVLQTKEEKSLLPQILLLFYVLITGAFLLRFSKNLLQIFQQIRKNHTAVIEGLRVFPVGEKGNPFSFFHFLFLNREDLENENYSASIIKHEVAHSKQYHSADLILLEFLSCFFWFNPFIWLYKKAVITNHEFLADAAVVRAGKNLVSYSYELIQAGNKNQPFQLISGFNFNQTKKRLLMLHSKKSYQIVSTMKIISVLLLFSIVFIFSSFKSSRNIDSLPNSIELKTGNTIESEKRENKDVTSTSLIKSFPFAIVEQIPLFPGCEEVGSDDGRRECTNERIRGLVLKNVSEEASKLFILPTGYNVFVQFRIDETGEVTNARARATSPRLNAEEKAFLEKEALSAVNTIPRLKPAVHDGQVVGVSYAVRL